LATKVTEWETVRRDSDRREHELAGRGSERKRRLGLERNEQEEHGRTGG
jgi:hypothetical protein